MRVQKYSKNSIFLFEIIINLLLFSILVTIGLSFFIKTHNLTQKTCRLHHALTWCSNVASIYEVGDGSLYTLSEHFAYAGSISDDKLILYLDEEFNETDNENYSYYVMISLNRDSSNSNLTKADITFYADDADVIYTITACNYRKITPSTISKEVSQ